MRDHRSVVGEDDRGSDGRLDVVAAKPLTEIAGDGVDLLGPGSAPSVDGSGPLDDVSVAVVFVVPPVLAVNMEMDVAELGLDGPDAVRADENAVGLAAAVAVAAQQGPLVVQCAQG